MHTYVHKSTLLYMKTCILLLSVIIQTRAKKRNLEQVTNTSYNSFKSLTLIGTEIDEEKSTQIYEEGIFNEGR